MAITNTAIVDTTSKYIVQSKGIKDETDQIVVDAEKLKSGTNESKVCLIECHFQIKGTGSVSAKWFDAKKNSSGNYELTAKGKRDMEKAIKASKIEKGGSDGGGNSGGSGGGCG